MISHLCILNLTSTCKFIITFHFFVWEPLWELMPSIILYCKILGSVCYIGKAPIRFYGLIIKRRIALLPSVQLKMTYYIYLRLGKNMENKQTSFSDLNLKNWIIKQCQTIGKQIQSILYSNMKLEQF